MEGTKDIFEENDANENWTKSEGLQNKSNEDKKEFYDDKIENKS